MSTLQKKYNTYSDYERQTDNACLVCMANEKTGG